MTIRQYFRQINDTLDSHLTRGVKWLILINVVVFLIEHLVFVPLVIDDIFIWLFAQNPIVRLYTEETGSIRVAVNWFCPMQFLSYMFVHANIWHLFWNMLALWFFGPPLEARWERPAFLKFYLLTGFLAGALHGIVAVFFLNQNYYMIGASGAIFAVLLAFAICYPDQKVLLWFVLPMPARYFVLLVGILTFLSLFGTGGSHVSHFTHLAGLGFGYLWIWLRNRFPTMWLFSPHLAPSPRRRRRDRSR